MRVGICSNRKNVTEIFKILQPPPPNIRLHTYADLTDCSDLQESLIESIDYYETLTNITTKGNQGNDTIKESGTLFDCAFANIRKKRRGMVIVLQSQRYFFLSVPSSK